MFKTYVRLFFSLIILSFAYPAFCDSIIDDFLTDVRRHSILEDGSRISVVDITAHQMAQTQGSIAINRVFSGLRSFSVTLQDRARDESTIVFRDEVGGDKSDNNSQFTIERRELGPMIQWRLTQIERFYHADPALSFSVSDFHLEKSVLIYSYALKGGSPVKVEMNFSHDKWYGWSLQRRVRVQAKPLDDSSVGAKFLRALAPDEEVIKVLEGKVFNVSPESIRYLGGMLRFIDIDFKQFVVSHVDAGAVSVIPYRKGRPQAPIFGRILAFNSGEYQLQLYWRGRFGMKASLFSSYFELDSLGRIPVDVFKTLTILPGRIELNGGVRRFISCDQTLNDLSRVSQGPAKNVEQGIFRPPF